jgi:hypothetical protein
MRWKLSGGIHNRKICSLIVIILSDYLNCNYEQKTSVSPQKTRESDSNGKGLGFALSQLDSHQSSLL